MSSYWKLEGNSAEAGTIQLYWTSSRSTNVRVVGSLVEIGKEREFESLEMADQWAIELGVRFWTATKTVRAFPIACKIPIRFPDAPEISVLEEAVERISSGETLRNVANQLGVDPGIVKCWLIGTDPQNECLAGFKK